MVRMTKAIELLELRVCSSLAEMEALAIDVPFAFAFGRSDAPPDRLMSPAVKGSKIMASPMRPKTAGADSALGDDTALAVRDRPLWNATCILYIKFHIKVTELVG